VVLRRRGSRLAVRGCKSIELRERVSELQEVAVRSATETPHGEGLEIFQSIPASSAGRRGLQVPFIGGRVAPKDCPSPKYVRAPHENSASHASYHAACVFRFLPLLGSGHQAVAVENLALRLQLAAYKRELKRPVLSGALWMATFCDCPNFPICDSYAGVHSSASN
jgi:hypothetical protein